VPDQEVEPDPLGILDDKDEQQAASYQRGDGSAAESSTAPAGRNILWHERPSPFAPGLWPDPTEHFTPNLDNPPVGATNLSHLVDQGLSGDSWAPTMWEI
jgi:hypothetical protein